MKLKPLCDRVVIKMVEAEETTALFLPHPHRRSPRLLKLSK